MESPDSAYVSSPDTTPKRSAQSKSQSSDPTEKPTSIRFLVSNAEAGSVIGKGGTTISEFQTQTGARIQLSRTQEYFPGTSDRIILISGTIDEILKAMDLVLSKLLSEIEIEEGDDVEPKSRLRIIVPNSSCGAIIGKAGATIRSFSEESQANIKISPQDNNFRGLTDRLVTVTGSLDQQLHATDLILSKLIEDPHYAQFVNVPYSYAAAYNRPPSYGPNGGGHYQNNKEDRSNSVTIGVADEHVGLVLGRNGRTISEISRVSGAHIKISDRGDFLPGTNERKVTITGSHRAIRTAEDMIKQKAASFTEREYDE